MVWQFDRLEDYLWDVADYLYDLGIECRDIPFVGWAIASIVYDVYRAAWYVAYYFERINDWADGIVNTLNWVDDWIDWFYGQYSVLIGMIAEFLSWSEIRSRMEAYYGILTDSYSTIVAGGKAAILGAYTSLDAWHDAQQDKIEDWVVDRFEAILDRVFS